MPRAWDSLSLSPRLVAAEATEVSTPAAASAAASAGEQGRASVLDNTGDGCTAATTYALHGVDLVSFFSLAAGDEPVIGSTRYSSSYGGYEYVFSSALNKALFEVCVRARDNVARYSVVHTRGI